MITYLLIISLILHVGTILWIVVLMQKINQPPLERESFDVEKATREIEDLLVAYTAEMKADNERLLNELIVANKDRHKSTPPIETRQSHDDKSEIKQEIPIAQTVKLRDTDSPSDVEEGNEEVRFSNYQPPVINETREDVFEQSDTLKVLTLAKQGLNVGEIAKKLNMGKGEVELLLKFYQ